MLWHRCWCIHIVAAIAQLLAPIYAHHSMTKSFLSQEQRLSQMCAQFCIFISVLITISRIYFRFVILGSDMGKVRLVPGAPRINSVSILLGLYCVPRTRRLAGSKNRWKAYNYFRDGYCGHFLFGHTEIYWARYDVWNEKMKFKCYVSLRNVILMNNCDFVNSL